MSLLHHIRDITLDPTKDSAEALRHALVLAHGLDHEPSKEWVQHELTG